MSKFYIGLGFDIHRLIKGRPLVLGGVRLPYSKGLLGHSDGDVLLHAICDALLGAAGLGDIGDFFPDTDPQYENKNSAFFLKKIIARVQGLRLKVSRVDTIIFAEEPKLGSKKRQIKNNVARLMGIPERNVNIKAKTMEGLGPIGSKKAMAAMALVLLPKK